MIHEMLRLSLLVRIVWIAVRLLIVLFLIQQGTTFVYQGF
jgi:hypothetical protein